jgi:Ca2+-transporting ATPase
VVQGLVITVGSLIMYQYAVKNGHDEAYTRSVVFIVLIAANIFLTLVNRSFYYSVLTTINCKNALVPLIIATTIGITALLFYVDPLTLFFKFKPVSYHDLILATCVGFLTVVWFEAVKWLRRMKTEKKRSL